MRCGRLLATITLAVLPSQCSAISGPAKSKKEMLAKAMAEIPKPISEQLQQFQATRSLAALDNAVAATDAIPVTSAKDESSRKRLRLEKLTAWLAIVNQIDAAIDPGFDPADVPAATVTPPIVNGAVLDSGIDPKHVRDPRARKAYEQAIEANKQKAERYKFQSTLRRVDEKVMMRLDQHVKSTYKVTGLQAMPEDQREIVETLNVLVSSASRKARLGRLLSGF